MLLTAGSLVFCFLGTDPFEQIFSHILQECYKFKLIDPSEVFVDATHVKAKTNNKKVQRLIARKEALFFEELLKKEINEERLRMNGFLVTAYIQGIFMTTEPLGPCMTR